MSKMEEEKVTVKVKEFCDGANTIKGMQKELEDRIAWLGRMEEEGWELSHRVVEGFAFMERTGDKSKQVSLLSKKEEIKNV